MVVYKMLNGTKNWQTLFTHFVGSSFRTTSHAYTYIRKLHDWFSSSENKVSGLGRPPKIELKIYKSQFLGNIPGELVV